jgi:hypothetical protein
LLTNCDFLAGFQQAGDICFCGMVGNAAHGLPLTLCKRKIEDGACFLSILIEHLIKIAQAKKKNLTAMLRFDSAILLEHCAGFWHENIIEGCPDRHKKRWKLGKGLCFAARAARDLSLAPYSRQLTNSFQYNGCVMLSTKSKEPAAVFQVTAEPSKTKRFAK